MDCMIFKLPLSTVGSAWSACERFPMDWSELHTAVASDSSCKVRSLVARGDPVNVIDFRQRTPCMFAVEMNSMKVLKELIVHGGDTSIRGVLHTC